MILIIMLTIIFDVFMLTTLSSYIFKDVVTVELRDPLNADSVILPLKKELNSISFKIFPPKLIIIKANSMGGSVVQGERIYNFIKTMKIPVHTYIDNYCLSACYYGISSSDMIFSSRSSIIGGIGVVYFNKPEPSDIRKDNRNIFAFSGKYKKPKLSEMETIKNNVFESARLIHISIIEDIKDGRNGKIKGDDETVFEGLTWEGIRAEKIGLIDAIQRDR